MKIKILMTATTIMALPSKGGGSKPPRRAAEMTMKISKATRMIKAPPCKGEGSKMPRRAARIVENLLSVLVMRAPMMETFLRAVVMQVPAMEISSSVLVTMAATAATAPPSKGRGSKPPQRAAQTVMEIVQETLKITQQRRVQLWTTLGEFEDWRRW